jgi:hypothetical protein
LVGKRERVFDWQGGALEIVRVVEGPDGMTMLWEPLEVVECVPLRHGLALPVGAAATVRTREGEPIAVIDVGVVGGRPACTGVSAVPGHELTMLLLRSIPIARLVRETAAAQVVRVTREDGEYYGERYPDAAEAGAFDLSRQQLQVDLTLKRRAPLDDDFLREVADEYRQAQAAGVPTGQSIRARWPTSEANARRWVARARERGFLGKAPAERRGGETTRQ